MFGLELSQLLPQETGVSIALATVVAVAILVLLALWEGKNHLKIVETGRRSETESRKRLATQEENRNARKGSGPSADPRSAEAKIWGKKAPGEFCEIHKDKQRASQDGEREKLEGGNCVASQPAASSQLAIPSALPPYADKRRSDSFLSEEDTKKMLQAFPVFEAAEGGRIHVSIEYGVIKELAESVSKYGIDANFTVMQLERLAVVAMTPNDWQNTVKAALPNMGQYLEWKALWHEASQTQAKANANAEGDQKQWTFELLTGQGQFANNQTDYDWAAYSQISAAAIKAWKALSKKGEIGGHLTKILQGPQEPFSDFVARMTEAADKIFGDAERVKPVIEQLVYKNASPECKTVITPRRDKGLTDWIKICRGLGGPLTNAGLAAAILQGQNNANLRAREVCYNCGKPGHLRKECHTPIKKKPPGLCTKCRKGYHWANECRSVKDIQGRIIQHDPSPAGTVDNPKNGYQGPRSQGPKKYGTRAQGRGMFAAAELQEAQQDWTSAPPPNSY